MAAQTAPDETQQRIIGTEGILAFHGTWKEASSRNTNAGVFLAGIGTWELAKQLDAHYAALIDAAYQRGVEDERRRAPY